MKKEKQGGGGRDPKFPVQATKNVVVRVQVGKVPSCLHPQRVVLQQNKPQFRKREYFIMENSMPASTLERNVFFIMLYSEIAC